MGAVEIIFGIVLLLFALAIIIVVLLQEGHQQSLGAITGGADTFLPRIRRVPWMRSLLVGQSSLRLASCAGPCDQHHYVFQQSK